MGSDQKLISKENYVQISIFVVFLTFMTPVFGPQYDLTQWAWMLIILIVITYQVMFRSENETMQLVIILFFTVFAIREFMSIQDKHDRIEALDLVGYVCTDATDDDILKRCTIAEQVIQNL